MNKGKWIFLLIAVFAISFSLDASLSVTKVSAAKISKEDLEKAKKEGDQTDEALKKARESYGKEADEANVESFETKTGVKGSGKSVYGVTGFDYLTGVGKIQSTDVDKTELGKTSPLSKKINERWKTKYAVPLDLKRVGEARSGWAKETGVTEVWQRKATGASKLGGDYNEWVNRWNSLTRPDSATGETTVAGADPAQGAHWFSFYCVHCHGWFAKGDGPTASVLDPRPRNQTNGKYMNHISNLELFAVIKGGGPARNLSESMPAWGNVLQDQDIWNVVAFMRSLAKPAFDAKSDEGKITAANAKDSKDFKESNEQLELEGSMGGRGGGLVGGYDTPGGGRTSSKLVGVKTKGSAKDTGAAIGDNEVEYRTSVKK
ncbi:MAG: cytochrome c [Nitrospinae bacterium]|nr:cytochrome c [Nitrospinota bacterium]